MRVFLLLALLAAPVVAKPTTITFATGFDRPLWVGAPPDDRDHIWVMEQAGKIWKLDAKTGKRSDQPFLDITSRVTRSRGTSGKRRCSRSMTCPSALTSWSSMNVMQQAGERCGKRL